MHWAVPYIGLPWVRGARGPDAYDCWGLLVHLYRSRYKTELPDAPHTELKEFARLVTAEVNNPTTWTQVSVPFEGCAVAIGGTEFFHHVGLWLDVDGGKILHCASMKKTVAETLRGLKASGMRRVLFYRHNGAHYSS